MQESAARSLMEEDEPHEEWLGGDAFVWVPGLHSDLRKQTAAIAASARHDTVESRCTTCGRKLFQQHDL